ncbi:MAG TPA: lysophospholipid acyltransferase family protein [Atribacteraceae bacterium]|nr:lysophospholipid acyltransferase family protein [Atribacteraceae bacterium]
MILLSFCKRMEKNLIWRVVTLLQFVSAHLSDRQRRHLGRVVGEVFYFFSRRRAEKAAGRCARILGLSRSEARTTIRRSYENLGISLLEILAFSGKDLAFFEKRLLIQGLPHLEQARSRGKGVILLSAHIGNWEMAAAWLGQRGFPVKVIGARQSDPRLTELIERIRRKCGIRTLWMDAGLRPALFCLRKNELLGILYDQDGGPQGIIVPFLGFPARTAIGPLRLALTTGAAILPLLITRNRADPTRHILVFFPALEIRPGEKSEITHYGRICNDLISDWIRQYPDQWLYEGWLYDRWICTH